MAKNVNFNEMFSYDVIPDKSYVKVTKVPTVYNVATGAATNDAVVEFTTAAVPADKKMILDFEPIKTTGEYNIAIQFMKEVKCTVKVQVVESK
mgnify:CR=1 FL=1